jgi:capsular polysaccharide biosynthesis protein
MHACPGAAQPFDRPTPEMLDPQARARSASRMRCGGAPPADAPRHTSQFLQQHAEQFSRLQDMLFLPSASAGSPGGSASASPLAAAPRAARDGSGAAVSRYAPPLSTFFVAAVPHAFVEGAGGAVYDGDARLFAPPGTFPASFAALWPAGPSAALAAAPAARHALLATLIQPYGWMYYHFVVETLPKLVLLRDALPALAALSPAAAAPVACAWNASRARVLLWGMPWEADWLALLRVPAAAAVAYEPSRRYAAALLLLPSPVPAVTPSAEALHAARDAVCAAVPGACGGARDLLVYASRAGERSRAVANEAPLLDALRAAFPALRVVVQRRGASAAELVATFARAVAVVGPHGAGLSHILFCQPGTAVVELVFMHSPPMMFWHMSAALRLRYAMAPLPHSYWRVRLSAAACARRCAARLTRRARVALPGAKPPRRWTPRRWWRCCGGCCLRLLRAPGAWPWSAAVSQAWLRRRTAAARRARRAAMRRMPGRVQPAPPAWRAGWRRCPAPRSARPARTARGRWAACAASRAQRAASGAFLCALAVLEVGGGRMLTRARPRHAAYRSGMLTTRRAWTRRRTRRRSRAC